MHRKLLSKSCELKSKPSHSQQAGTATTEKLVYVYSNSGMVASIRDSDELKMFALDNEDV